MQMTCVSAPSPNSEHNRRTPVHGVLAPCAHQVTASALNVSISTHSGVLTDGDAVQLTWGNTYAGRRLAKALRPDLKASSPLSGRCSAGRVSHLYLGSFNVQKGFNYHHRRRLSAEVTP